MTDLIVGGEPLSETEAPSLVELLAPTEEEPGRRFPRGASSVERTGRNFPTSAGVGVADQLVLPTPPTDGEKYSYLQSQQRTLVVGQITSSLALSGVLTVFFLQHAVLRPFAVFTLLNACYILVSAWSGLRKRRVSLDDHVRRVATWRPHTHPSVDVFLPSAGEPLEVLANTYRHVARMAWAGERRVLVLDDSGRDEVAALAREHGFHYLSRPDRGRLKKAGNLKYGFERSRGEYIVIFDADFCPREDFLGELMPYFDDPAVGIVQSPQYFDTHGPMNWLQSAAGSVQEIFYRWVQPSRDAVRGAICVGTCAIYRRAGLERSGGFAQIGHSEDVHTGVNLMKVGYGTRYVPVVVSAGLCPDNLAGFLAQQYRWCAGSMSLLVDTSFHGAPLSLNQRLCFFTGFLYYISTAALFFGGPLAAAALVWFIPEEIWPWMYLPLVASSWLTFLAWRSSLHARWNLSVIRVQLLYSAAHALAIWHAARGATMAWVPTGSATKGASLSRRIQRLCFGWIATIDLIAWVGIIRGAAEQGLERFWLSLVLMGLATVIVVPMFRPMRFSASRRRASPTDRTPLRTWAYLSASVASLVLLALMATQVFQPALTL